MKINSRIFWILCVFFAISAVAYTIWAYIDYSNAPSEQKRAEGIEWVGTIAIALTAVLSAFIAFYVDRVHKAQGGELPEDRADANIDDGDPELGHFSPWSWWPITLAGGAALLFLGFAVGIWIAYIGVAVTLVSIIGWVYEYYRGNFVR